MIVEPPFGEALRTTHMAARLRSGWHLYVVVAKYAGTLYGLESTKGYEVSRSVSGEIVHARRLSIQESCTARLDHSPRTER